MNEADALDIVQYAIWTVLTACGPAVGVAMLVGVGIALVQALTQIQEMTLSFVPKILVMFVATVLLLPFMVATLSNFTERLADRIVSLE